MPHLFVFKSVVIGAVFVLWCLVTWGLLRMPATPAAPKPRLRAY
jgi:hypothetical protein